MSDNGGVPSTGKAAAAAGETREPRDLVQSIGATALEPTQSESASRLFPAFDQYHAPQQEMIDDCVHCGFCLPSCPTYLLFGEEMDSPRGRIYLMKEALEGEPLTDAMVRHWDLCLGCLACVTACPSGVQYEKLIESTRQQVERRYHRPFAERFYRELLYAFLPYPRRLQVAALPLRLYNERVRDLIRRSGLFQRLPASLQTLEQMAPPLPPRGTIPEWTPAVGDERKRVGVMLGCVQRVFFPEVNAATVRVLAAEGCGVAAPAGQGCCGALSAHVGREREAQRFARRMIDRFEAAGVGEIIVNVAGCGSLMKEYGYLLRDDPRYAERAKTFAARVRDASEFLQSLEQRAERHPLPLTAVYHDACHLAHGQGIRSQPRQALQQIPGLELREVPRERDICCGSAGTYNLLQPGPGRDLGNRKARNVREAGAQLLVTSNPGCHLQITSHLRRQGISMPAAHVMQVVDASIRSLPLKSLLG